VDAKLSFSEDGLKWYDIGDATDVTFEWGEKLSSPTYTNKYNPTSYDFHYRPRDYSSRMFDSINKCVLTISKVIPQINNLIEYDYGCTPQWNVETQKIYMTSMSDLRSQASDWYQWMEAFISKRLDICNDFIFGCFVILHEYAHGYLEHTGGGYAWLPMSWEEYRETYQEKEADEFAFKTMIDNWDLFCQEMNKTESDKNA
jgi:hypothetical protein